MREELSRLPPEVMAAEHAYIKAWRKEKHRTDGRPLTGLAFSGGGIRSAVFCLGALQALAKHNVLGNFDYLSTVSGGGYIGSSLTWFTRSATLFGVEPNNLPYGIDDPTQPPPKDPPGQPLLPYLRRHGSYLDPNGPLSLAAGLAVVLRGLVLNLFVIWLPLVTLAFVILRIIYRGVAHVSPGGVKPWIEPWSFAAIVAFGFMLMAIAYSLYSGYRAARHEDMPYKSRQEFERIAPWVIGVLVGLLIAASLPYARDYVFRATTSQGVAGFIMTAAGAALGLWSRFVPKRESADGAVEWAGPIGASLVIYGYALFGYGLSGIAFVDGDVVLKKWPLAWVALAAALAALVGYFVDLNETTLHRFYRDRLMEAFMPNIVGGFPVAKHATEADAGRLHQMCPENDPKGPYHLICAHLVLTRVGERDAAREWVDRWRIRGGDSFVFSPRYCGSVATGWHETDTNQAFSELSLPTAMATSGAAVNPDAASSGVGPQRNMAFAMLMALLNIRLGIWLPNPIRYGSAPHAPAPNHFNAGFWGLLDRLSPNSRFLEVTDGGNFENLGVYELLRRGVQTIVVCDATADPKSAFADLQNLLDRAEADFGVTVTFPSPPLGQLMPSQANARFPLGAAFTTQPFVIGSIRYPAGSRCGKLYYVKPAIFAGLRLHILGFKGAFPAFPDDSTLDQFFDESRFEAYRELGFACVQKMLEDSVVRSALQAM